MESRKKFDDLPEIDFNIVKDHEWAKNMWKYLNVGLQKTFLAWITIVLGLSSNKEDIKKWVNIFEENFEDTCSDLVTDMEGLRSGVVEKIEHCLVMIQKHCKTLQIEMPVLGNEKFGLLQEKQLLQKRIDEYEAMIRSRSAELNELRSKQTKLCEYLGKKPKLIQDEPLPSSEELDHLHKHVEKLEEERFNRMEIFYKLKQEILEIIAELKYKPSTKFEEGVVNSDDFKVSNENMKLLSRFHQNLREQLKGVKEEIAQLWSKIDNLWNVLDVALLDREHFKQANKDTTFEVLEALRKELSKCEDLKKANIETFIIKLRHELEDLWEKCHFKMDEGMEKFGFYASDCYTEDLLELHEVEVEKWKKYFKENKEIIQLLNKHNTLWLRMKSLEEMSANPNRFNNRGGQLLKEEKERNMLDKKIPSMEESLVSMANKYEILYGIPFKTFGLTIPEYFENLHIDRENAKKQKLSARKLQNTHTTITCSKSVAKLFPSSTVNIMTPKRKTPTVSGDQTKKMKYTPRQVATEPTRKRIVPKITLTTANLTKRRSMERKHRFEKRRRSARHQTTKIDDNSMTEYGEFQSELTERNDCRSTLDPTATSVLVCGASTPRKLIPLTQSNIKSTPSSSRTTSNKLTVKKSNFKLIF